ncbi:metal-dependent hydrolase [Haloarculaceae archaeon H-GB2-1]|nr:metal-dependent hydrolase [Haloarculaceae archaeon H-GB1-1]MEA5408410.1 metal-dependent hydrolase [Haloarculaceae archaeon H-GB2-1]
MWPWEHLSVGYLAYSTLCRMRGTAPPSGPAALAVAAGTQFPDFVDKPLAWSLSILPSGSSLAHSVFTGVVLSVLGVQLASRFGHRDVGVGFAVGYLAHLPADAIYPALLGGEVKVRAFLWPLVTPPAPVQTGFTDNVLYFVVRFLFFLATPVGLVFLAAEILLVGSAVVRWSRDGYPGIPHSG